MCTVRKVWMRTIKEEERKGKPRKITISRLDYLNIKLLTPLTLFWVSINFFAGRLFMYFNISFSFLLWISKASAIHETPIQPAIQLFKTQPLCKIALWKSPKTRKSLQIFLKK